MELPGKSAQLRVPVGWEMHGKCEEGRRGMRGDILWDAEASPCKAQVVFKSAVRDILGSSWSG